MGGTLIPITLVISDRIILNPFLNACLFKELFRYLKVKASFWSATATTVYCCAVVLLLLLLHVVPPGVPYLVLMFSSSSFKAVPRLPPTLSDRLAMLNKATWVLPLFLPLNRPPVLCMWPLQT